MCSMMIKTRILKLLGYFSLLSFFLVTSPIYAESDRLKAMKTARNMMPVNSDVLLVSLNAQDAEVFLKGEENQTKLITVDVVSVIVGEFSGKKIKIKPSKFMVDTIVRSMSDNSDSDTKSQIIYSKPITLKKIDFSKPIFVTVKECEFSFNYCVTHYHQTSDEEALAEFQSLLRRYSADRRYAFNFDLYTTRPKRESERSYLRRLNNIDYAVSGKFLRPTSNEFDSQTFTSRYDQSECFAVKFIVDEVIGGEVEKEQVITLGYRKDYIVPTNVPVDDLIKSKVEAENQLSPLKKQFVEGVHSKKEYVELRDNLIEVIKSLSTQIRVPKTKLFSNNYILIKKREPIPPKTDKCFHLKYGFFQIWPREDLLLYNQSQILDRLRERED